MLAMFVFPRSLNCSAQGSTDGIVKLHATEKLFSQPLTLFPTQPRRQYDTSTLQIDSKYKQCRTQQRWLDCFATTARCRPEHVRICIDLLNQIKHYQLFMNAYIRYRYDTPILVVQHLSIIVQINTMAALGHQPHCTAVTKSQFPKSPS
jgi:hypothetical protein